MHISKRLKKMEMSNRGGKSIAFGILERVGKVRTMVVDDRERATLQAKIRDHVESGAEILAERVTTKRQYQPRANGRQKRQTVQFRQARTERAKCSPPEPQARIGRPNH